MYINSWTPDFDLDSYIPSAVLVWVRVPHLPLHCWGDDFMKDIRNKVRKYIDEAKPKQGRF